MAKCSAARLALPKVLPSVYAYCQEHKAAGGLWDHDRAFKLLDLWDWLDKLRPKNILELGAGCTTAVFCEYIKRHGGKLTTVEESQEYVEPIRQRLSKHIGYDHAIEVRPVVKEGGHARYCLNIPVMSPYDFIYIDGPAGRLIGTDAVVITAFTKPAAILFDGRVTTATFFAEHRSANYWIDWGIHKDAQDVMAGKEVPPWYLNPVRYHTVARRKR